MINQDSEPKVLTSRDFKFNGIDDLVPGSRYTEIKDAEGFGGFGLYFMEPGSQTSTFSLESEDDGTADEYYGPCFEFYFLISGEITMYWGKDAAKLKKGEANELHLKAGDFGCWEKGWKFSAKNTGVIPAMFFWGLGEPPEGVVGRAAPMT
jgi:mannose-6-phosphate isomerase-like protein (cupin superfamily)